VSVSKTVRTTNPKRRKSTRDLENAGTDWSHGRRFCVKGLGQALRAGREKKGGYLGKKRDTWRKSGNLGGCTKAHVGKLGDYGESCERLKMSAKWTGGGGEKETCFQRRLEKTRGLESGFQGTVGKPMVVVTETEANR